MSAIQLNIYEAQKERDKGIAKAINHANEAIPEWEEKAYRMFKEWLSGWAPGHEFLIEDFRFSAEIKGLEKPPSSRSYGPLAIKAKKEGLIVSHETAKTRSKSSHRANAAKWIKI